MFGTNKRYKKGFVEAPNLVVNSVFATIQGEGIYAGVPAIFIRMAHCNLACTFCDTEFETGEKVTPQYLLKWVNLVAESNAIKYQVLVITGGEPLLQDMSEFLTIFHAAHPGVQVQIETAGTVWHENLYEPCVMGWVDIICSPKTFIINKDLTPHVNAYKYIVREGWVSDDDGLPDQPTQPGLTKRVKVARPPSNFGGTVYVQPVDEQDAEQNQKNLKFAADIAMKHGYSLSVQIHKLIPGLE